MQNLVLEDGTVFPGIYAGAAGVAAGEACFTTSMTGYEEAVTDPSYVAQVLCFAYPLIGTYGVDEQRMEQHACIAVEGERRPASEDPRAPDRGQSHRREHRMTQATRGLGGTRDSARIAERHPGPLTYLSRKGQERRGRRAGAPLVRRDDG